MSACINKIALRGAKGYRALYWEDWRDSDDDRLFAVCIVNWGQYTAAYGGGSLSPLPVSPPATTMPLLPSTRWTGEVSRARMATTSRHHVIAIDLDPVWPKFWSHPSIQMAEKLTSMPIKKHKRQYHMSKLKFCQNLTILFSVGSPMSNIYCTSHYTFLICSKHKHINVLYYITLCICIQAYESDVESQELKN
jgi:hypothetical protein